MVRPPWRTLADDTKRRQIGSGREIQTRVLVVDADRVPDQEPLSFVADDASVRELQLPVRLLLRFGSRGARLP